jgi:hypothetical protein
VTGSWTLNGVRPDRHENRTEAVEEGAYRGSLRGSSVSGGGTWGRLAREALGVGLAGPRLGVSERPRDAVVRPVLGVRERRTPVYERLIS